MTRCEYELARFRERGKISGTLAIWVIAVFTPWALILSVAFAVWRALR